MNAKLYIDKGTPFVSVHSEVLTDGSVVWNLDVRGGEVTGLNFPRETIACVSEQAADKAFELIAEALTVAAGERPLIL